MGEAQSALMKRQQRHSDLSQPRLFSSAQRAEFPRCFAHHWKDCGRFHEVGIVSKRFPLRLDDGDDALEFEVRNDGLRCRTGTFLKAKSPKSVGSTRQSAEGSPSTPKDRPITGPLVLNQGIPQRRAAETHVHDAGSHLLGNGRNPGRNRAASVSSANY